MGKAQVGKERVVQRLNVPDRHVARRSLGAQCACSWRDDRILCFPVVNSWIKSRLRIVNYANKCVCRKLACNVCVSRTQKMFLHVDVLVLVCSQKMTIKTAALKTVGHMCTLLALPCTLTLLVCSKALKFASVRLWADGLRGTGKPASLRLLDDDAERPATKAFDSRCAGGVMRC